MSNYPVQEWVKRYQAGESANSIAESAGAARETVRHLLRKAGVEIRKQADASRLNNEANATEKPTETRTESDIALDITIPKTRIKTVEELIKHCKVDTSIWEVKRFTCAKYEQASIPRTTRKPGGKWVRPSTKPVVTELFAIKAEFVKKALALFKGPEGKIAFVREIKRLVEVDTNFSPKNFAYKAPTAIDKDHHETAVVMSSDQHFSETVRPEDANGINIYNSIIGSNRLFEQARKVISILTRHMGLYTLDKIWIPILGDTISGSIHDEYLITNDLTDPAAVILAARLLVMFIREIMKLGLPIEVDCVHGNHARMTPKMPTKRQAHTNLDWLVYEIMSELLKNEDQVKFNIVTAQIGMKKIYDWNFLFEHGMDAQYKNIEGLEDRLRALFDDPTYREATGYAGASFDQILLGDFHKPTFFERSVVNGSLIGQNELGQSWRLKPIKAQQLMFGVGQKFIRTWQYAIDMTHVKSERADNHFSEYATWFMKKHGK